jgi:hypothetical protein
VTLEADARAKPSPHRSALARLARPLARPRPHAPAHAPAHAHAPHAEESPDAAAAVAAGPAVVVAERPLATAPAPLGLADLADLGVASLLVVAAAVAALQPGGGDPLRMALAGLVVFVLPGYLLLEVLFPARQPATPSRAVRAAACLGLSPAMVGLAALSTALVHGGFRPANIVAVVTLLCLALAGLAAWRRLQTAPARAPRARSWATGPRQRPG